MEKHKKNWSIVLIFYIVLIFLKDYYFNLLFLMLNGFQAEGIDGKGVVGQVAIMVGGSIIFAWAYHRRSESRKPWSLTDDFGINGLTWKSVSIAILLGVISFFSFHLFKNAICIMLAVAGMDIRIEYMASPIDLTTFLFLIMMLGVWMALGEELLYRGILYHWWNGEGVFLGLIVFNVLVFIGAHDNGEQMLQTVFFGTLLCFLASYSGGISMGMIAHIVFNCFGLWITYYWPLGIYRIFRVQEDSTQNQLMLAAFLMMLVALMLLMIILLLLRALKRSGLSRAFPYRGGKLHIGWMNVILTMVVVGYSIFKIYRSIMN